MKAGPGANGRCAGHELKEHWKIFLRKDTIFVEATKYWKAVSL
jgi:hypothetical protein